VSLAGDSAALTTNQVGGTNNALLKLAMHEIGMARLISRSEAKLPGLSFPCWLFSLGAHRSTVRQNKETESMMLVFPPVPPIYAF
jgi:hypothetical protein